MQPSLCSAPAGHSKAFEHHPCPSQHGGRGGHHLDGDNVFLAPIDGLMLGDTQEPVVAVSQVLDMGKFRDVHIFENYRFGKHLYCKHGIPPHLPPMGQHDLGEVCHANEIYPVSTPALQEPFSRVNGAVPIQFNSMGRGV